MRAAASDRAPAGGSEADYASRLGQVSVLAVDDEIGMRNFMRRILEPHCRRVETASGVAEAGEWLAREQFDVIVLDNLLGGLRGLDWLIQQKEKGFTPPVVLISAYADLDVAIEALKAGAADMLLKPFRSNQLLNAVLRSAERLRLESENHLLRHQLRANADHILLRDRLIGDSPAIAEIREMIARVAPMPSSVLLTGQSGTGKEVAARMIHELSDRAQRPFVPVNCAAIPADMVESELFGHLKGAFTGALASREGLFLHAQGGTLFLDEIGDLPPSAQAKLLRVLEERKLRPLGAEREIPVDLRLIFATNADLKAAVAEGRFRADLYYRINILHLHMPPLSARGDDAQALAALFMEKLSRQLGTPPVAIGPEVRAAIAAYGWPGNVRELRNAIERALILGRFPEDFLRGAVSAGPEKGGETLAELEERAIRAALAACGGDRDRAALKLGVSRRTIERRCASWGE